MAEGSQLREYDVLFSEDCFCLGLSFLLGKESHLFVGIFEDGCLPEIIFFPYFALIDLRVEINESFILLIVPVESEDQTQNSSDYKSIALLLTFFEDRFQNLAAHLSAASILDHDLELKSVLFKEKQSDQSI